MPLLSLHSVRGILYFLYMSHTRPLLFPLPAIQWFPFSNSNDSRVLQLLAVFTVCAALQLQLLWFFDSAFAPSGRPYPNIFSCRSSQNLCQPDVDWNNSWKFCFSEKIMSWARHLLCDNIHSWGSTWLRVDWMVYDAVALTDADSSRTASSGLRWASL